ncbi:hypothetical protein FACS1894104_5760 [Actinomycetota bacterium]|nr:hypothetical protein FACS1894104_5760 [Actinomycetota bacterium]
MCQSQLYRHCQTGGKIQELLKNQNDGFVLVKPQFELPKALVKDGVVKNPKNHQEAIEIACEALISANLAPVNLVASKLLGPKGNLEFFLWVKKAGITANIDIEKVVQEAHLNQDQ